MRTYVVEVGRNDRGGQRLVTSALDSVEDQHQPDAVSQRRIHPSLHGVERRRGGRSALPLHILLGGFGRGSGIAAQDAIHEAVTYPIPSQWKTRSYGRAHPLIVNPVRRLDRKGVSGAELLANVFRGFL